MTEHQKDKGVFSQKSQGNDPSDSGSPYVVQNIETYII